MDEVKEDKLFPLQQSMYCSSVCFPLTVGMHLERSILEDSHREQRDQNPLEHSRSISLNIILQARPMFCRHMIE